MEWFRWYGGTFNDPKLHWIANKSCQTVSAVLAVWVAVLERAHSNETRGCCAGLDFESLDIVLGLDDGAASDIYQAMRRKAMIVDGDMVAAWDKRQPKTEDVTATDRQRNKRDKDKLSRDNDLLRQQIREMEQCNLSHTVTPVTECHGMSQQVTTEESRLEEKREEEPLKPQQQHAREQLAEAVEEHKPDLQRLFPDVDIPVAVAKLLHHFRDSERLIDPWMTALKWLQREFKHPAAAARASPPSRGKQAQEILAANAAACRDFCQEGCDAGN